MKRIINIALTCLVIVYGTNSLIAGRGQSFRKRKQKNLQLVCSHFVKTQIPGLNSQQSTPIITTVPGHNTSPLSAVNLNMDPAELAKQLADFINNNQNSL